MLCGGHAAATIISDKWLSWSLSAARRLPFVPSLLTGDGRDGDVFARRYGYPLLVKPRAGFASRGMFLALDGVQLRRAMARPGFIVQQSLQAPDERLLIHDFNGRLTGATAARETYWLGR